ncbi:MAG: hypothetical protein KGL35_28640 [Bradyrhizobium sp.]|nr:hypothetical protein [Bradyrhizobium sp.]
MTERDPPKGILVLVRDDDGIYRGTGNFHAWPIRGAGHNLGKIGGRHAIQIDLRDMLGAPKTGPSVLIDGFGHEDADPVGRGKK